MKQNINRQGKSQATSHRIIRDDVLYDRSGDEITARYTITEVEGLYMVDLHDYNTGRRMNWGLYGRISEAEERIDRYARKLGYC